MIPCRKLGFSHAAKACLMPSSVSTLSSDPYCTRHADLLNLMYHSIIGQAAQEAQTGRSKQQTVAKMHLRSLHSTTTMSSLCLTCSATLSESLPSHSEKPDPPTHHFTCNIHSICGRCVRLNRRLTTTPCLICESVHDLLATAQQPRGTLPTYSTQDIDQDFIIGDDDHELDLPPTHVDQEPTHPDDKHTKESPPAYADPIATQQHDAQPVLHYLQPNDTLTGLALHYRTPVSLSHALP